MINKLKAYLFLIEKSINKFEVLFFLLIFLFLVSFSLSFPPERRGDGSEYILKTESLLFDHDLEYSPSVDAARHYNLRLRTLDSPSGIALDQSKDGKTYLTRHAFYYSLFSIPFYWLFSLIKQSYAYYGFQLFNAIMIFFVIYWVNKYLQKITENIHYSALLTLLTSYLSPVMGYLLWIHPETFLFFLITGYLDYLDQNKPIIASIFIGFAACQQPPLLLLSLLLFIKTLLKHQWKFFLFSALIVVLLFIPQYLINQLIFGTYFTILGKADVNIVNFSLYGFFFQ